MIVPRQTQEVDGVGPDGYAGSGSFEVDIPVARLYAAIGYLCNAKNEKIDPYQYPLDKGKIARVCVQPSDFALDEGVKMRSIDSFTWTRQALTLSQVAVTTNAQEAPGTEIFCRQGEDICSFQTNLDDNFYGTRGIVNGNGFVWLQFGSESRRVQFNVGLNDEMEPGFAGASGISLFVFVLPDIVTRELYRCRAYECNNENREIVPTGSKRQGMSVRMCVSPESSARKAGARMWSVESWKWTRKNFIQDAIAPQGKEGPDGRTLQMCERGSSVCAFQTRLDDRLFNSSLPNSGIMATGAMKGVGYCWLTFGYGGKFRGHIGRVEQEEQETLPDGTIVPIDPKEDALFAGANSIGITWSVVGNFSFPIPYPCEDGDHKLKTWGKEEDPEMKILFICGLATIAASICGLFYFGFVGNQRRDGGSNSRQVEVNIDVQDHNMTENFLRTNHDEVVHSYHNEEDLKDQTTASFGSRKLSNDHSANPSTLESGRVKDSEPREEDVCFGCERHPGTREWRKIVNKCLRENPDASYDPSAYRFIKKRLRDKRFFVQEFSEWREASKQELISKFGEAYQKQTKNGTKIK
jgi:hypothetical protein